VPGEYSPKDGQILKSIDVLEEIKFSLFMTIFHVLSTLQMSDCSPNLSVKGLNSFHPLPYFCLGLMICNIFKSDVIRSKLILQFSHLSIFFLLS
jgi:hypothetical protein